MLRIKFERIVEPKTMMSPVQESERRAGRRLLAATLIIILALAGHVGFDILGRSYLEYELAACEFDRKNIRNACAYEIEDCQNEIEQYEITISKTEKYLREQGL